MSKYISKKEKDLQDLKKEKHILELLQKFEVKDIVKIYPDLNSRKISKIVIKSIIDFNNLKYENRANKGESGVRSTRSKEFYDLQNELYS